MDAEGGERPTEQASIERRNLPIRSRCDALAGWFELHPSVLSRLDAATVVHMASRLGAPHVTPPAELGMTRGSRVAIGGFLMDRLARTAHMNGQGIALTALEFDLLSVLVAEAGVVQPHRRLVDPVSGPLPGSTCRMLYVYIRRLRAKLDCLPGVPFRITTVRGIGYRLDA